jgi:hypothetical protein
VLERPRRLRAPPLRRAAVADGGGLHGRRLGSPAGRVRFRDGWGWGTGGNRNRERADCRGRGSSRAIKE